MSHPILLCESVSGENDADEDGRLKTLLSYVTSVDKWKLMHRTSPPFPIPFLSLSFVSKTNPKPNSHRTSQLAQPNGDSRLPG